MLNFTVMPKAEKFINKIKTTNKDLFNKYKDAVIKICDDPSVGTRKHGDLDGFYGYDISHNGINYELSYIIGRNAKGELIVIVLAGTRENFYNELKKYIKANKPLIKSYKG